MIRRRFPRLRTGLALTAFAAAVALSGNVIAQHDARIHPADPADQTAWLTGETQKEQEAWELYQKNRLISAASRAEDDLEQRPDAILSNFVLGVKLHQVDGDLQQALHHLAKAREVLETRYNCRQKDTNCPWKFHRDLLFETQLLAKELEEYEFQLEILDYQDQLYDPVLTAEHAWPLMKLGRVKEAVLAANKAIESKDAQQQRLGHNALCAIFGELGTRAEWYDACVSAYTAAEKDAAQVKKKLKKDGTEDSPQLAVHAYNAAVASYAVLKFDEVERLARAGSLDRAKERSVANPWRVLAAYYIGASRVPEAVGAVRNMIEWRGKEPPQNRDQDAADTDASLASLLLISGDADSGLRLIDRAIARPDRRGLVSGKAEQAMGAHALIRRALLKLAFEKAEEEASFAGLGSRVLAFADRAGQKVASWPTNERIASVLSGEASRLTSTFRFYVAGGLEPLPAWLVGDLVEVLGAGVVSVVLEEVEKTEDALRADPKEAELRAKLKIDYDMRPYYAALKAEVALAQGELSTAAELADRALAGLPQAETILRARVAAVASEIARRKADDRGVLRYLEVAFQYDGGIIRRLGLAIPAHITSEDAGAAAAAELIGRSPRFYEADGAFRVVVRTTKDGALEACLSSATTTQIACSRTRRRKDDTDEAFARRAAKDFHAQAFTLHFSLSQTDLTPRRAERDGQPGGPRKDERRPPRPRGRWGPEPDEEGQGDGARQEAAGGAEDPLKFALEHSFSGLDADAYVAIFFDEKFNVALGEAINLGREVVLYERSATRVRRHLRCEPIRVKESLAERVFGESRASFMEELDFDLGARRGRWRTIPSAHTDKVTIEGTIAVLPSAGGVTRRVEGNVKVSMFGVGGLVEKHIVAEIRAQLRAGRGVHPRLAGPGTREGAVALQRTQVPRPPASPPTGDRPRIASRRTRVNMSDGGKS